MMNRHTQAQVGFTLIELMIVLAIVAVLVVMGTPSLRQYIMNQQLATRANALAVSFNFARGEAVSRNNSEGITITARNGDWKNGWWVWEDNRNAGECASFSGQNDDTRNTDGCEDVRSNVYTDQDAEINVAVSPALANAEFKYLSSGLTDQRQSLEFHLCIERYATGRIVSVSRTGRVSINEKNDCPTS